jgi:hypothetical protein
LREKTPELQLPGRSPQGSVRQVPLAAVGRGPALLSALAARKQVPQAVQPFDAAIDKLGREERRRQYGVRQADSFENTHKTISSGELGPSYPLLIGKGWKNIMRENQ